MDRRVKRTKALLKKSLIELLKTDSLSRVTVTDVCRLADINRSTYYTHYLDVFDQAFQMKREFFDGVKAHMIMRGGDMGHDNLEKVVESLCKYYYDNRETYLAVCSVCGSDSYESEIEDALVTTIKENLKNQNIILDEDDLSLAIPFMLSGSNRLLKNWLNEKKEKHSTKEIASLLIKLCYEGNFSLR